MDQVPQSIKQREREIFQLMLAAESYLHSAETQGAKLAIWTNADAAREWDALGPGQPPSKELMAKLRMGAELGSAAVRLATIEEICSQSIPDLWSRAYIYYADCNYAAYRDKLQKRDFVNDRELHLLLRHNIAHKETKADFKDKRFLTERERWAQRQQWLESLSPSVEFSALSCIADALRQCLKAECNVEVPPFTP